MSIYGPGICSETVPVVPQKPIVTVWAEERGGLRKGEYEWSFGNNAGNRFFGYTMLASGTILRMSLSSVKTSGQAANEIAVNLVLNGEDQKVGITKPTGLISAFTIFENPVKVRAGSVINFVTITGSSASTASIVALIIELDL